MRDNYFYILDEKNNVVPVNGPDHTENCIEWGNWFEENSKNKRRVIKQESIDKDYYVSTVFLGIDHGYNYSNDENYQPLVFETMVFFNGDTFDCQRLSLIHISEPTRPY